MVPKLDVWGDFIIVRYHISARKLRSTLKPSEKRCLGAKSGIFPKKCIKKGMHLSWTFPALQGPGPSPYRPIWALMGLYGPIWAHMGPIWVLLDRSGHDQIVTFGPISHVSDPKLAFWRDFISVLKRISARTWRTQKKHQKTSFGPETCEIGPKVLRKVYVIFQDLSRRTHKGPHGPIWAHMGPYMCPYMGPLGPQPRANRVASQMDNKNTFFCSL